MAGHKEGRAALFEEVLVSPPSTMDYIEGDLYTYILTGDTRRLGVFLRKGLNINYVFRSTEFPERLGKTMLEIAVRQKQHDVIKFLVEKGSDANLTYVLDMSGVGCLIKPCRKQDRLKLTVMYHCIVYGDVDMIRLLVQGGFDVNIFDDRGCSALWHAVDLRHYQMVKVMLSAKGCDVNLPDRAKLRPLHIAAIHGNTRMLTLLLRHGAKVDAIQVQGSTPLCLACRRGDFDSAKYLLMNGANPNHVDYKGNTPLSSALESPCDVRLVNDLIATGARVTKKVIQTCQRENPSILKEFPDILSQLRTISSSPQTLQMTCGFVIRRCLMKSAQKSDLWTKSSHLPIPKSLQDNIALSHLCLSFTVDSTSY